MLVLIVNVLPYIIHHLKNKHLSEGIHTFEEVAMLDVYIHFTSIYKYLNIFSIFIGYRNLSLDCTGYYNFTY